MKTLVLTVQSCGNGNFRLGINSSDSLRIFKCRHKKVKLLIEKLEIGTKTSCGTPCLDDIPLKDKKYKKGFDLYDRDLDTWIKSNNLINKIPRKPIKLKFELSKTKETFILKYINES